MFSSLQSDKRMLFRAHSARSFRSLLSFRSDDEWHNHDEAPAPGLTMSFTLIVNNVNVAIMEHALEQDPNVLAKLALRDVLTIFLKPPPSIFLMIIIYF